MKKRPFLVLLAVAASLASGASCRCSGDQNGTGTSAGSSGTTTGTAEPTLAERGSKLPNGLQVDLVDGPCGDAAALAVLVNVGIDHDPPGRSGMARLAGRILATSAAAGRAERTVETGGNYTLYSVVVPGDRLADELDDVAAWMSKVAPTEADLARERARLLEDLGKLTGADAALTAQSLAEEAVQPSRGNGKRGGIPAEIAAITLPELQAFWEAHVKPGNTRLSVAGRFDIAKARARIDAAFTPLPAGTPGVSRDPGDTTVKGTLVMGDKPRAVAIAIPAPPTSDPLYAPFLILAARLMDKSPPARTWETSYDPLRRPELLLIAGPVAQGEQPEPSAARIRAEVTAILTRAPTPDDAARARETFQLFLEPRLLDPAICAKDARAFTSARVLRSHLAVEPAPLLQSLEAATKEELEQAARFFEPKRTAAVIAGGTLR